MVSWLMYTKKEFAMIRPIKEAFLKHDLYKLVIEEGGLNKPFPLNKPPNVEFKKIASIGARFVYCETDRSDNQHGWYADVKDKRFVYQRLGYSFYDGGCGFGIMSGNFVNENLTEPTPLENTKLRSPRL